MKKISLFTGITISLVVGSLSAQAGSLTIPNSFTSGSAAVAADVNANFSAVVTEVDDNNTRITANAASAATNAASAATNTTHSMGNGADHANVASNSTAIAVNASAIGANTTHSAGNGADHANVASNTSAIGSNTAHRTGNGSDHANVASNTGAISTNVAAISLNTTHRGSDGSADHANVALNDTHRLGDGNDHSAVNFNSAHSGGDGSDHTVVAANTAAITALQGQGNPTGQACAGNDAGDIMVRVGPLCVDKYEASVWDAADGSASGLQYGTSSDDYTTGGGGLAGGCSDNAGDCTGAASIYARSETLVVPSASITWFQAQQACMASGKRLLTNAEWQAAAAGSNISKAISATTCNVSGGIVGNTDANASCTSNWAVVNMVGNVNEWVADWMQGARKTTLDVLLNTGGVSQIIDTPVYTTGAIGEAGYGSDVTAGVQQAGVSNFPAALYRGGGPGGAGEFQLVGNFPPSTSNNVIGFRCAR